MKEPKVDPRWLKDMRRARALAGVILLGFDEVQNKKCFLALVEIRKKWGEKYDPSGFGLSRSDLAELMGMATLGSTPVSIAMSTSIVLSGKDSLKRKSRKVSRSTT